VQAGAMASSRAAQPALVVPRFQDVASASGVATTIPDAHCGAFVTGAAWGDVNGDGKLDLFVARLDQPSQLFMSGPGGRFVDEAAARGVVLTHATGAVFADYDNDGHEDLFVVRDGQPDLLFHNDGSGHFQDVSAPAGISSAPAESSSASWADFNGDGYLDLYVTNYASCVGSASPGNLTYTYYADKLYLNNRNGTFSDVTPWVEKDPSITTDGATVGAGFQAVWFDYNGDGRPDLYLANDYTGPKPDHNHLWRNDGPGPNGSWAFTDVSVPSGTAYSMNAMGIAVGDFNRDGKFDLALSNIRYNRLLANNGDGTFTDVASAAKVDRRHSQSATQVPITWATSFYDFNLDGWEDLYFASGNLNAGIDTANGVQPNELFVSNQHGGFVDMSDQSHAADTGESKGIAFADYDHDGRMDMYVVDQAGTTHLYHNVTPTKNHWLEVKLVGTKSNRDACGATLLAQTSTGPELRGVFCGGTSVASGSQEAVLFGLGADTTVKSIAIRWPSGRKQVLKNVKGNQYMTVVEPR
jgi:hypothetical protein